MTWRAHLDESFDNGLTNGVRLMLADVHPDWTVFMHGDGTLTKVTEPGVKTDYSGIILPRDPEALAAIATALGRHVPSVNEMRRLEQTLDVERRRVDALLTAAREKAFGPGEH